MAVAPNYLKALLVVHDRRAPPRHGPEGKDQTTNQKGAGQKKKKKNPPPTILDTEQRARPPISPISRLNHSQTRLCSCAPAYA